MFSVRRRAVTPVFKNKISINFPILMTEKRLKFSFFYFAPNPPEGALKDPWTPLLKTTELWSRTLNHIPWSFPCDSDTLTASWLLKELTPIMPWEAVLAREGIWLWLRGTLYRASAMSAALFRMISWKRGEGRGFVIYVFFIAVLLLWCMVHGYMVNSLHMKPTLFQI